MDLLDRRLIDAWHRVMARCEADPDEARRRYRRVTETRIASSVPRAWAIKLRAGDTRLDHAWCVESDWDAVDAQQPHTLELSGDAIRELCTPVRLDWPGVTLHETGRRLGRHPNTLRRWLPVKQGRSKAQKQANRVRLWEHYRTARCRPRSGALPSEPGRAGPTTPADPPQPPPHPADTPRLLADKPGLHVRYEKASSHGKRGNAVPIVWADRPLDPGAARGDRPHPLWGSA
ncbi:MAG: hypothetical protein AAF750_08480 [Planctomycetota bacterium]